MIIKNRYDICCKETECSITVEAALAFPIFFYAVMALCMFFTYMETANAVRDSMLETARQISSYGDVIRLLEEKQDDEDTALLSKFRTESEYSESDELSSLTKSSLITELSECILKDTADSLIMRILLENEFEKRVDFRTILNGKAGIDCAGSRLITDDDEMFICCKFTFKAPVALFGLRGIPIEKNLSYRYFTGEQVASLLEEPEQEGEQSDDQIVFVTENGKVYHFSLSCPSLKLDISEVNAEEVGIQRNEAGGKYYPCEKCAKGKKPNKLFITADGDRYHYEITCGGLKRTIKEIHRSEVGKKRPCKRCGKEEKP